MENEVFYNRDKMYENIPNQEKRLLKDVEELSETIGDQSSKLSVLSKKTDEDAKMIVNTLSPPLPLQPIKADGTNDAPALQAILDFSSAHSATVKLPPGVIGLSTPLKIKSNIVIEGAGNSTLKALSGFTGALIEPYDEKVTNFSIKNLTLDGNKTDNSAKSNMCLKISNAYEHRDMLFENVIFQNAPYHGVWLDTGTDYIFNNCKFIDNGMVGAGNGHGAGIFGSATGVKFTECSFLGSYEHGVYSIFKDVSFEKCVVMGNGANGLSVRGNGTRVNKCYFSSNGEVNPNYGANGLAVSTTYGRVSNVFVTECLFENQKGNGGLYMDSDVENVIVDNNIFKQDTFYAGRAVNLTGGGNAYIAKNVSVTNNTISGHQSGIYVQFDAFNSLRIFGNTIVGDATNDIVPIALIANSNSAKINGDVLVIYGNILKASNSPITLYASATLNKVKVYGNIRTTKTEALAVAVADQSEGTEHDIESYSQKSVVTVDFATVTAQSTKDVNIVIPLAGYNCYATLTPTATSLPAGVMFMPISRGNNTNGLTVRAINVTAADVVVGSITFSVEVKK
jgi:Right handed beta helix region